MGDRHDQYGKMDDGCRPATTRDRGYLWLRDGALSANRNVMPQRVERDLTERQQATLALLDQAGRGLALREIYAQLKPLASERQVREDLAILRTLGLVAPTGHGRGARWNRL